MGGEILGDSVMASAVLDRILRHFTVVNISGDSYRLKKRKKSGNISINEVKGNERKTKYGWKIFNLRFWKKFDWRLHCRFPHISSNL